MSHLVKSGSACLIYLQYSMELAMSLPFYYKNTSAAENCVCEKYVSLVF